MLRFCNVKNRKRKRSLIDSKSDKAFYYLDTLFLVMVLIIVFYPLYYILIASVSDYKAVGRGEVVLWPKGFSLDAYIKVFKKDSIMICFLQVLFAKSCK